jgi:hypothetical protein
VCGTTGKTQGLCLWPEISKSSNVPKTLQRLINAPNIQGSPSMRRPAAKRRWHGPSRPRQTLSEHEIATWFERIDAIRQNRAKKPKKHLLPPSLAELSEEFA